MNLTHVIATALAGAMMLEATGLAQTAVVPAAIPRAQAIRVLVTNIQIGSEVHVELLDGSRMDGRLLEKGDDALVVVSDGVRQVVPVAELLSLRLRPRPAMTNGRAFGIGAGVGAGIFAGLLVAFNR